MFFYLLIYTRFYKKTIIFAWASIFLTFTEIDPEIFFNFS